MSLNVQNASLYIFGLTINGLLYVFQDVIKTGKYNQCVSLVLVLLSAFTRGGLSLHRQLSWPRHERRLDGPVRAH